MSLQQRQQQLMRNQVVFSQIYGEKERQQREFQTRFIDQAREEKRQKEEYDIQEKNLNRNRMKSDTLNTIVNQMNEKQAQVQQQQELKRNDLLTLQNQELEHQRRLYMEQEEQKLKKISYKEELQRQIEQDRERKQRDGQMSAIELNMNKKYLEGEGQHITSVLPGQTILPDFEKRKQRQQHQQTIRRDYLDLQLNGQDKDNYVLQRRQRNVSAYQAANNIISMPQQSSQWPNTYGKEQEEKKLKKIQYKEELQRQIEQDRERKQRDGQMSALELNMNKKYLEGEGQHITSVVPGQTILPDFERRKQRQQHQQTIRRDYLDLQLNGQDKNNYVLQRRQRNVSAYQAANNIISMHQQSSQSPNTYRKQPITGY